MLRALVVSSILLAAGPCAASAQTCWLLDRPDARIIDPAELRQHPPAFPFPEGERLEYAVRYFGVEIGRASLEVARFVTWQGRRMAHVVGTARTNAFFSVFYRVDDRTEAWIDADRLRTLATATHTRHGRRREIYEEVRFDWRSHFVLIRELRRHAQEVHRVAVDFGPFVHDTFEALYALRAVPLKPGVSRELPLYASQKVYGFRIDVAESEPVHSRVLGKVPTVIVRPYNELDGERQDNGRGRVWVSADARQIPLRTRGWLRSTQGLRIDGLSAELVGYDAGRVVAELRGEGAAAGSAWPHAHAVPHTVKGRPQWEPPSELEETRRRLDAQTEDLRLPFSWPAAGVGCPAAEPAPSPLSPDRPTRRRPRNRAPRPTAPGAARLDSVRRYFSKRAT